MKLYRALLRAYPASFRAEYGEQMCQVFARRLSEAGGRARRLAVWAAAVGDVFGNAFAVHADILRHDVRATVRGLRRAPGFAVNAVLITALGVGAVTAAFSLADHVLLRPLPYPAADRLVHLWENNVAQGYINEPSPPNYRDWKRSAQSFEAMGAHHPLAVNLVGAGPPQHLEGVAVDEDLLPMLGAAPMLGRVFTPDDHRPGAPGVLLLSEAAWKGRFGGDPAIVGRKLLVDDAPSTVIGVLARRFSFPRRDTEIWAPMRLPEDDANDRGNNFLTVVGRLKKGVTLESARAEMRVIGERLRRAYPKENAETSVAVRRLRDELSSNSRLLLVGLLGASAGVLTIACVNLANLLLVRAVGRRRELAVRTALGAGRERLARQLLTESALLAGVGGALGIALALAALPLLARLVPTSLPIADVPNADGRMLAFACVLTVMTGVGFGVLPALRLGRRAPADGLRDGTRAGADRRTERLRSAFIVAEITASVALLIPSGLLLRALWRVESVDPGFRASSVLTLHTALPMPKYEATERRARFYAQVLEGVRALPGVSSAGYISFLPMVMSGGIWPVEVDGEPAEPASARAASLRFVTSGFFATLGIPLTRGRDVRESDDRQAAFVAVVSESFVRRHWPGADPLGRRIQVQGHERQIVGVAGEVRVRGLEQQSEPQVYLPSRQVDDGAVVGYAPRELVVRASVAPGVLLTQIREVLRRADPDIPVSSVRMLADVVEDQTAPRRLQALVLGGFAAIAALLAGVGIHGLLAFSVSQRAREIGVRIAVGAQPSDILRLVLRRAAGLCALGIAAGAALAFAAGHSLRALLAGVQPADGPTFLGAIALVAAVVLIGSLLPALRAARLDPLKVLAAE